MTREEGGDGLDALFQYADEQPARRAPEPGVKRPPSRAGWVVRNLLLVAVATTVTVAGLRMAGLSVPLLIVVSAFAALRLLMLAVAAVSPPSSARVTKRASGEEPGEYHWAGSDSLRTSVRRWELRLDWSQSDADRFSRNVLPVLAELTDERLRLRHGITRSSDPRRARELVGEPLWLLLADPGRRPPKRADLAGYVDALERL
ncbi:hypothetical protein AB0M54_43395 [Actinoplanes sp. NPDC051470]|uniref:hypothetical protein n=1 Tax=Actinoplanes sp. NPDC051470 TaxID=3157224 RepID=UPI0034155808